MFSFDKVLDAHDVGSNKRLFQYIQENKTENINSGPKDVKNSKLCKVEGKIKRITFSKPIPGLSSCNWYSQSLVNGI